jgi:hypothetical protein
MILSSLLAGLRGQAALQAENIALRHQLTVLQRTQNKAANPQKPGPMSVGLIVAVVVGMAFGPHHGQA